MRPCISFCGIIARVVAGVSAGVLLSSTPLKADITASVSIWHGYDFYYPNLGLSSANPPETFHWMESASGALWKQLGSTNGSNGFFLTNSLDALIHECTNGIWKLYLNRGHASEELYYFKLNISEVTSNILGDVTISYPLSGSSDVPNQATFEWTGPSNLPVIQASSNHETSGNSHFTSLPGTATSWTPGELTPGPNTLFINYHSNNYPGIVFTTPTNAAGVPLEGWTGTGNLHSYMFSSFTVEGSTGGGGNLVGHYRFDNSFDLGEDASGKGNDGSVFYAGGGSQFPQFEPNGVADGAVEFDGFNGFFWDNALRDVFTGSYSVSLWIKTTQSAGPDHGSVWEGAGILDADGDPMPLVLAGSYLAFDTGYAWHTLYSDAEINSGAFTHVVVTYDAGSGLKSIFIDGVLDNYDTDSGETPSLPNEVNLGYSWNTSAGFVGIADDLQVYGKALNASQVEYLYNNPGMTVPGGGNGPVDVEMEMSITRNQDHASGEMYLCFPRLQLVNVPEVTEHRVESPNDFFSGTLSGSSSVAASSIEELIDECTNGSWRIYINKGDPTEEVFTFTMSLSGIDTNLLKAVTILSPVNGSTNVSQTPSFEWSGPEEFNGIFVQKYEPDPYNNQVSTVLSATATHWPSPPTLNPGTNRFYINYHTNDAPHATFSMPVNDEDQTLNSWSTRLHLNSDASVQFVVSPAPMPTELTVPIQVGGKLQFEFLSQSGRTHTLQTRTNLTTALWEDVTNFTGTGGVVPVEVSIGAGQEYFRIQTQ